MLTNKLYQLNESLNTANSILNEILGGVSPEFRFDPVHAFEILDHGTIRLGDDIITPYDLSPVLFFAIYSNELQGYLSGIGTISIINMGAGQILEPGVDFDYEYLYNESLGVQGVHLTFMTELYVGEEYQIRADLKNFEFPATAHSVFILRVGEGAVG